MIDCRNDPSLCATSAYTALLLDSLDHWYCEGPLGGCPTLKVHRAKEYDERCPICRGDERYPAAKAEGFLLSLLDSNQQKKYLGSGHVHFEANGQKWDLVVESFNNLVLHGEGRRCITWAAVEDINPPIADLMSQCYLLAKKNMDLLLEMVKLPIPAPNGVIPYGIENDHIVEHRERDLPIGFWQDAARTARETTLRFRPEWHEHNDWANRCLGQTADEARSAALEEVEAIFLDEEGWEERRIILRGIPPQFSIPESDLVQPILMSDSAEIPDTNTSVRARVYQLVTTVLRPGRRRKAIYQYRERRR